MIAFGFISDKLGRKPGMFLTTVRCCYCALHPRLLFIATG